MFFRNVKGSHQELEVFFQIIISIKYLRESLSLVELQAYSSFTKNELYQGAAEQLFATASEAPEYKHMYQIGERDSLSLDFEQILT